MSADAITSRVDNCRPSGKQRWMARCPAHEDKSASLSIRELDDGRILIHCFAGCSAGAIMQSVGLEMADLMPESIGNKAGVRRPFDAFSALKAVRFEVFLMRQIAKTMRDGKTISDEDRQRAGRAETIISEALNAVEGAYQRQ